MVVHVLLQLIIVMIKQKSIFEWIGLLFTAKVLQEAMHLTFPLPGPNHLQNLNTKFKILNVFWT